MCNRKTSIHGTHGEIIGDMKTFTVTDFRTGETTRHTPHSEGGGHGGGDSGLMRAFVKAVRDDDQGALGLTPRDILTSHLMVFAAEESRLTDETVKYRQFHDKWVKGSVVRG